MSPDNSSELDKLTDLIRTPEHRAASRERLFQIIVSDPSNARARVLLAKSFYDDGLLEFSVRELVEAKKYTDSVALTRLIEAFGDHAKRFSQNRSSDEHSFPAPDKTVAEIEVELDFDSTLNKLN